MDDLPDLGGIHRRQFYELGKNVKPRCTNIYRLGFHPFVGQRLLQRQRNDFFTRRFLRPFGPKRLDGEMLQTQTTSFIDFKLRELEAARPEINGQK